MNYKKNKNSLIITVIIYLVFLFWVIALALTVQTTSQSERLIHILLACLMSPIYVIGFYLTRK